MIILDTNVISEFTRPQPSERVRAWFRRQNIDDLVTTAVTEGELYSGVMSLPDGRRKLATGQAYDTILENLGARIHSFDRAAAREFASITAQRQRAGLLADTADCQIAAIARILGASIATRNIDDFIHTGVKIINPWTA
ncbi:MAG TPA: type II toxin-antitoxin system VapC family toxin [Rhizomicrobium sp.]